MNFSGSRFLLSFHMRQNSFISVAVGLLLGVFSMQTLRAQCDSCKTGEVQVEFSAIADIIKGSGGSVRVTIDSQSLESSPKAPDQIEDRPFEPDGGIGPAATGWGKIIIQKDVEVHGSISVDPTGVFEDYTANCLYGSLGLVLRPSCLGPFELKCKFVDTTEFQPADDVFKEGTYFSRKYRVTSIDNTTPIPSTTIRFILKLEKKKLEEGEQDPCGEENSPEGPSMPEPAQGSPPDSNGEPVSVSPAKFSSTISVDSGREGYYAGSLKLSGDMTPSMADITKLDINTLADSSEVEVVRASGGVIRQLKTPTTLYDVQTISGGGFEVRMFKSGQFGTTKTGGVYPILAGQSPYSTVRYTPVTAAGTHLGGVQITRIYQGQTETKQYLSLATNGLAWREKSGTESRDHITSYTYHAGEQQWHVNEQEFVDRNGGHYSQNEKESVYQLRRNSSGVVLQSNLFLLSEANYPSPSSSPLVTTYEPDPVFFGKTRSVTYPDGSWVAYRYYGGTEGTALAVYGMVEKTLRPWNGLPASASAATPENSQCTVVQFDLTNESSGSGYRFVGETTTLPSVGVIRKWTAGNSPNVAPYVDLLASADPEGTDWYFTINNGTTQGSQQNTYTSEDHYLVSTSVSYRTQGNQQPWNGRTFASLDESGKGALNGYQRGSYDAGTGVFTVQAPATAIGGFMRSVRVPLIDGILPPVLEATKEVTIQKIDGPVMRRELWVRSGTSTWELASAISYEYTYWPDGSIRVTVTRKDGRIISEVEEVSPYEKVERDEDGIEVRTITNQDGQTVSVTTTGVAAGAYEAQPDRITSYVYSVNNGETTTTTYSGGGLSWSESSSSDMLGRTVSMTDRTGAVTTLSYPNGGRNTLTVQPGGTTRLETRTIDGKVISLTGTGMIDENYEYAALAGGTIQTTRRVGDLVDSPRYTKTTTDWAGRTLAVSVPSPEGILEQTLTSAYSASTGEAVSQTSSLPMSGSSADSAPLLYSRPVAGSSKRYTGFDVDGGGLSPASTDRITETSVSYVKEGGVWWQVSTQKKYDVDNSAASAVTTTRKTCLHGQPAVGIAEKSVSITPTGETTTTATTLDRVNKIRTATTSRGGTANAVAISQNGLAVSSVGFEGGQASRWRYDGLGQTIIQSTATGALNRVSYNTAGQMTTTTDTYGQTTTYAYYGPSTVSAGKLLSITRPGGITSTYVYDALGNVIETAGSAEYKVTYEYDEFGAKKKMFTWRTSGTGDATVWTYHEGTGLLASKTDASSNPTYYIYDISGKVSSRTTSVLGTAVNSNYYYNAFSELESVHSDDGTPDVRIQGYDRLGRYTSIQQEETGTEIFSYQPGNGSLNAHYYDAGHSLLPGLGIRMAAPAGNGKPGGFMETSGLDTTVVRTVGYGYDDADRLATITDGSESHHYGYQSGTNRLTSVESRSAGTAWFRENRYLDTSGRLIGIQSNRMGSASSVVARISSHAYDYDALGRRIKATQQDGSKWEYGYNSRSEVTSTARRTESGTLIPQLGASYAYDGIGNRSSSSSAVLGDHTYTTNSLNQYATLTTGNSRTAVGRAPAAWNVEVYPATGTPATASRVGEIYHKGLTAANGSAPVWQSVITRRDTGSPSFTGNLWYSPASVTPVYDADGNLTDDGRWLYTWDAQNRLIRMETTPAATTAGHPYTKLTFRYDWQGRRLERAVWKGGTAASPTFSSRRRWLYDGWNPIAEFDSNEEGTTNTRLKTFTWGLDLSGTLQEAGGVGGLIVQTDVSGSVKRRASYDGNGNIVAWTRSNQSGPDYRCEYDAFGNTLVSEGTSPSEYGFSTKQQDAETGLYYYGYRYYDAVHGRWLNRDPIEEEGGVNLYGFTSNDAIDNFDILGKEYERFNDLYVQSLEGTILGVTYHRAYLWVKCECTNSPQYLYKAKVTKFLFQTYIVIRTHIYGMDGKYYQRSNAAVLGTKSHEDVHVKNMKRWYDSIESIIPNVFLENEKFRNQADCQKHIANNKDFFVSSYDAANQEEVTHQNGPYGGGGAGVSISLSEMAEPPNTYKSTWKYRLNYVDKTLSK